MDVQVSPLRVPWWWLLLPVPVVATAVALLPAFTLPPPLRARCLQAYDGMRALHCAVLCEQGDVAELLVRAGERP